MVRSSSSTLSSLRLCAQLLHLPFPSLPAWSRGWPWERLRYRMVAEALGIYISICHHYPLPPALFEAEDEVLAGRLPRGSHPVLREAVLAGHVGRAQARQLTGFQERMGRTVISKRLGAGLLVPAGPKHPLRLGFPLDVVERWFPKLYPVT